MKTKVLHVYPQLNCGGTEMVFYNLIKFSNKEKFDYTILTQASGNNEDIFIDLGVKIERIPLKNKKQYYISLLNYFRRETFDVVHVHTHAQLSLILKAAMEMGIKCRVAHSHTARIDIPQRVWPLLYFIHHPNEKYASILLGCSNLALKWLFPTSWPKGQILHNGIDLNKFKFDASIRSKIRKENSIPETTKIIINVGRCSQEKNQKYILDLANHRLDKDELYVIIGDGPLLAELKYYKELHQINNVRLLGTRTDVSDWLNASDIFLFPSIYEGLGIAAIEAQATGLIVLATDTIPSEANMQLGTFHRIALNDRQKWYSLLNQNPLDNNKRDEISNKALSSEYNITKVIEQLELIYTNNS